MKNEGNDDTPQGGTPLKRPRISIKDVRENPKLLDQFPEYWPLSAPSPPKSDNFLDDGFPPVWGHSPEYRKLGLKWKVALEEAKKTYVSWAMALRLHRKMLHTGTREPTNLSEYREAIRFEIWRMMEDKEPLSECLRHLMETIQIFETVDEKFSVNERFSVDDIKIILTEPSKPDRKPFLKWLIDHWIKPDGDMPPLCLCSDGLLEDVIKQTDSLKGVSTPSGDGLRQAINKAKLYRPKKPRLRVGWLSKPKP